MFERTMTLWRRITGRTGPEGDTAGRSGVATQPQEDRRLWVRFQSDVQASVQVAQDGPTERVSVRVRDISLGGANLLADRPFQPGQILSLESPAVTEGESQVALVCVVRATPEGPGQWSVGCVFSRELTMEDLEVFGARKNRTPVSDQRTWVRHACDLAATYHLIGQDEARAHAAQVLNISPSGVGLLLTERIELGALINVSLHGKQHQSERTILACVVHCTHRANGEVAVGCNFIRELGEAELGALL
jgi:head-tail adaptor